MQFNCFDILSQKGYELKGYSIDTIAELLNHTMTEDECVALLWWLENVYG